MDFENKEVNHAVRFEKVSRYYVIRLEKDLLDYWTVTANNGRINSRLGQTRIIAFLSFIDAFTAFCDMIKLRYQRGYQLKNIISDNHLFLHLLAYVSDVADSQKKTISQGKKTGLMPLHTNRTQPVNPHLYFSGFNTMKG